MIGLTCPHCQGAITVHQNVIASLILDSQPADMGIVWVCHCGEPSVLTFALRPPMADEHVSIMTNPQIIELREFAARHAGGIT